MLDIAFLTGLPSTPFKTGVFMSDFNIDKIIQITAYILKKYAGELNYTKLIKLIYLADRKAIEECNRSISGDSYFSFVHGPVLQNLYYLLKGEHKNSRYQSLWNSLFMKKGIYNIITLTDRIPDDELSAFETDILDQIDAKYHDISYDRMIDIVHTECSEWQPPTEKFQEITKTDILRNIGRTDEQISFILEDDHIHEVENSILGEAFI